MKKIAIICELKERELTFLSILKKKLELLGHEVTIIPQRILCGTRILLFKPDFIIVNGLRSDNNFLKQVFLPKYLFKSKIISIYSEQVGKDGSLANTYSHKIGNEAIDIHIAWGEGFAEGLSKLGVDKNKIWVLGSLAIDLKKYFFTNKQNDRNYISQKYNLDPNKKWILVADNIIRKNKQPHLYSQRRRDFDSFILVTAKNLKECEIIFRPHPDTKGKDFKNLIKTYENEKNIKFVKTEHVIKWILQSVAMIIWRSTSSIESWLNDVEVFAVKTKDKESDYWHEAFFNNYQNIDEFLIDLKNYIFKKTNVNEKFFQNRERYIDKWFYRNDGKSYDRISYLIDQVELKLQKISKPSKKLVFKAFLAEYYEFLVKMIKGEIRRFNITEKEIENELSKINVEMTEIDKYRTNTTSMGNNIVENKI